MRAISIGALLLATPAAAQEPWYEYGDQEWGFQYWQGTFVGAGITLPHKLMINYPATTAGLDAPIATSEAPYPVIFFQHAGGSWYDNYDYLFSRLASRGFLVVSAQHDDDATWFCCGTYDEKHEDLFHATIDVVFQWNADPSEFLFGMAGFAPLCEQRAVDVVMPDVKHCGGLTEARRIAAIADLYGVAVSPHNPSGPVATAASVHNPMAPANASYAYPPAPVA